MGTVEKTEKRSCSEQSFLADDEVRRGIEAMFFAYRGFTSDPDRILSEYSYGRAHHRAIHFINRCPGTTVKNLLDILGVTKQSLNRVLRKLIEDDLVKSKVGENDRRERHLELTLKGLQLEKQLSEAQRQRMSEAYSDAGFEAVLGFRKTLEKLMDKSLKTQFEKLVGE
jgi:DNA-binding MarR family transcriptional regulator